MREQLSKFAPVFVIDKEEEPGEMKEFVTFYLVKGKTLLFYNVCVFLALIKILMKE